MKKHCELSLAHFQVDPDNFDLEWLEDWQSDDNYQLKSFRITTSYIDQAPVRTYGIVGFPKKIKFPGPGILHFHGGGQKASEENVLYHVRRGYVTMTFDWTGPNDQRPPETSTIYPKSFASEADHYLEGLDKGGLVRSYLFHAPRAARCCLKFLSMLDEVNEERIGFYGISWGGFMTWLVNATDNIPKCAVPIYGTGGIHWPHHYQNNVWYKLNSETRKLWGRYCEPLHYAINQQSPVLHISGSNDFFGGFDVASEMLPLINREWYCDYTPGCNHHFDRGSYRLIERWFDYHLKGEGELPVKPKIWIETVDDKWIIVKTEISDQTQMLWYSHGSANHLNRCWHSTVNWQRDGSNLITKLATNGDTWIFIRRTYPENGMSISSEPICCSRPSRKVKSSKIIFKGNGTLDGIGFNQGTEIGSAELCQKELSPEKNGIELHSDTSESGMIIFFGASEPGHHAPDNCKAILLETKNIESITMSCFHKLTEKRSKIFRATLTNMVDGVNRFALCRFKDDDKNQLKSFEIIAQIGVDCQLRSSGKPMIKSLHWE